MDELPLQIIIESHSVSVKMLAHESNLFAERDDLFENYKSYSDVENGNGAIFMCCGFSIAIIWKYQGFISLILTDAMQEVVINLMENQYF